MQCRWEHRWVVGRQRWAAVASRRASRAAMRRERTACQGVPLHLDLSLKPPLHLGWSVKEMDHHRLASLVLLLPVFFAVFLGRFVGSSERV